MTEQKDYGGSGDDIALVPGALTAYRHFALLPGGRLGPVNLPNHWSIYDPLDRTGDGVFEACCIKRPSWSAFYTGLKPVAEHDSPDVDCTCGFYAHYEEYADFYKSGKWTADSVPYIIGFGSYHVFAGSLPSSTGIGFGMVRAVVELSGKIVMGRLGVRAQKLKIKALAVDWGKFHQRPESSRVEGVEDVRAFYEASCSTAAASLGAEYFAYQDMMLEKYPKPDLSALGITPAKPEPPEPVFNEMFYGFKSSFGWISVTSAKAALTDVTVTYDEASTGVVKAPAGTPMQRAILNKKLRPAPPGTGIDRRKRKL